jgi:hypothetical protein
VVPLPKVGRSSESKSCAQRREEPPPDSSLFPGSPGAYALEWVRVQSLERLRPRVNGEASVLQRHDTKERLGLVGGKNAMTDRFLAHELCPDEPVVEDLHGAIREFAVELAFNGDAKLLERLRWDEAMHSPCVDQKEVLVRLLFPGQRLDLDRDMRLSNGVT